jgi:hypothetical protein
MAAPSCVFTIARVALMLGKDEDLLSDLAMQLEPEDGRLWIYDTDDRDTLGFVPHPDPWTIARLMPRA